MITESAPAADDEPSRPTVNGDRDPALPVGVGGLLANEIGVDPRELLGLEPLAA